MEHVQQDMERLFAYSQIDSKIRPFNKAFIRVISFTEG